MRYKHERYSSSCFITLKFDGFFFFFSLVLKVEEKSLLLNEDDSSSLSPSLIISSDLNIDSGRGFTTLFLLFS